MGVLLEIRSGPAAGKMIAVTTGRSVTVGRASGRAEIDLPQDTFMSGVHFAVECSTSGCRVQDRKSSNGTFLNGARVQDAMLANGDEIKAGQTIFAVKILSDEKLTALQSSARVVPPMAPADERLSPAGSGAVAEGASAKQCAVPMSRPRRTAQRPAQSSPEALGPRGGLPPQASAQESVPQPVPAAKQSPVPSPTTPPADNAGSAATPETSAVAIMGWRFPRIPPKWQVQEGLGFQSEEGEFPSSVAATQESLGGMTLSQFAEFQLNMLKNYLREARIEPVVPPPVAGAEETLAVDVRHKTKDGSELVYRRIYAQKGSAVGVLTVTALAGELGPILESLAPSLNGVMFREGE